MEPWKDAALSKAEEAGVTYEEDDGCEEEVFQRTLAGKLWTESPYNVRAFKQTMIQAWRLKNPVEIQDLSKTLFLFRFSHRRDAEAVLRNGPWNFDRNILILDRVSGDEQPSELTMHRVSFWVRAYELPLKMRFVSMATKLGNMIGRFEEVDTKDAHRMGRFLRFKVSLDLRKPLMRATFIKAQERSIKIFFKYERLPTFCFSCGKIGHQVKECEEVAENGSESYEDIEEHEYSFGPWLRASPLPKTTFEQRKETSSGYCSKNLFSNSSSSKCASGNHKSDTEEVVEQTDTGAIISNLIFNPTPSIISLVNVQMWFQVLVGTLLVYMVTLLSSING